MNRSLFDTLEPRMLFSGSPSVDIDPGNGSLSESKITVQAHRQENTNSPDTYGGLNRTGKQFTLNDEQQT